MDEPTQTILDIQDNIADKVIAGNNAKIDEHFHNLRTHLQTMLGDFATLEHVNQKIDEFSKGVHQRLDEYLDNANKEEKRRQAMFDQRFDQLTALVTDSNTRSVENEKQIAALRAAYDQRFDQIEARLNKAEDTIKNGVAKVAQNSTTMNRMVSDWIAESKRKDEKNDLEIKRLDNARVQFEKDLREQVDDIGNLRQDVDGLRADIATKVTTTDLKVKHIDSELSDIKQRLSNQDAEQALVKKWVIDIQVQTKAAFWLLNTIPGRVVLITVLALLGISNLVS